MSRPHTPPTLAQGRVPLYQDESLEPLLPAAGSGAIIQKKRGYRFSVDALLLAALAAHYRYTSKTKYLDIGTGCGIVPLLLAAVHEHLHGYGVEIQEAVADMARRNCTLRGVDDRISILCMDVKALPDRFQSGSFDVITSNPPYRTVTSGRINPDAQKAVARHEIHVTLGELLSIVAFLLRPKGTFFLVYPAGRCAELIAGLRRVRLQPKRLRPVYPDPAHTARLVLVEAHLGGGDETVLEQPLFIRDQSGEYSPEMQQIYEGRLDTMRLRTAQGSRVGA